MNETKERNWVEEVGAPAYASIAEMVGALTADRERLDELRDERQDLVNAVEEATSESENADEDEEDDAQELLAARVDALTEWDEENAEELAELEAAVMIDGEEVDEETARERIQEDPLSLEVRSSWTALGEELTADEFCILLTTGGPAVRIVGDLDRGEPSRARLEVQDWGKPWTKYFQAEQETLLAYCGCFYFGE